MGEYDDSDSKTVAQHLKWSRQANIQLWITSWWGAGSREDLTTKDAILEHPEIGDHKIALFYETTGRIKEEDGYSTHRVVSDIEYISKEYFGHPNYFRMNGRPVLFVYLTRKLESIGILEDVITLVRKEAQKAGHDIFIVGDQMFRKPPDSDKLYAPFSILDAVTNYDVYGSMGVNGYAGSDEVKKSYKQQQEWREIALSRGCSFIPSVSPGYNDLGVRPEKNHGPLSRKLAPEDSPGSLFRASLVDARKLVDPNVQNFLVVNSFNEWHEDTQIEPVAVAVGDRTNLPDDLTKGLEYEGYGDLYLDILRNETLDYE